MQMRALTGELLLAAWEEGAAVHEQHRAVTMLSIALPDSDARELSAMPIAQRDLMLLRLHQLSFGPSLSVFGICPKCEATLEFEVPAAQLASQLAETSANSPIEWTEHGRRYRIRPPTTDDLLATTAVPDPADAERFLLSRCLEVSPPSGDPLGEYQLGEDTRPLASPAVAQKFDRLLAAAELSCAIECPACSSHELHDLDVARFLWTEVRTAARRLLSDIHQLASAYGWSEQAIATMSATRRDAYLEMLSE